MGGQELGRACLAALFLSSARLAFLPDCAARFYHPTENVVGELNAPDIESFFNAEQPASDERVDRRAGGTRRR